MATSRPDALARTEARSARATALAETIAAASSTGDGPAQSVPSGGDRFRARSVLGEGGMGRVHDADDLQFGRRVALKELTGEGAELGKRFAVEALVTGNLEHPGIPAVYERGVRDGKPFYAMKKLEGRSLDAVIADARTLEERLAIVPVAIQVAHTLGFAHERGIVHRDVKPENVMIGSHGEVWLVDWGIAKVRGTDDARGSADPIAPAGATVAGSVMGTPAYMAPEQARGDVGAIDERTDVFALGAMLYHVLSGRAPYAGPTSVAALAMALEGKREPLTALAPRVPPDLAAIVDRAMAQDPRDRFPDAGAMATALEKYLAQAALGRPSTAVRAIAALASVVVLAMSILGTAAILQVVSSFREQGFAAWFFVLFTVIGIVLTAIEWWTKGRHRLMPLSLALAAIVFLGGVASTVAGYSVAVRYVIADVEPARWSEVLLQGFYEATGNLAMGSQLAIVQIILAAIAARSVALSRDRARGAVT